MHVLEILIQWGLPQVDSYKFFIIIPFGYLSFPLYFPFFYLSSLLYLIISPVPTCLVHNCETSWGLLIFSFVITFVSWSIPFDLHHHCILSHERIEYRVENIHQLNLSPRSPLIHSRELHLQSQELLRWRQGPRRLLPSISTLRNILEYYKC